MQRVGMGTEGRIKTLDRLTISAVPAIGTDPANGSARRVMSDTVELGEAGTE